MTQRIKNVYDRATKSFIREIVRFLTINRCLVYQLLLGYNVTV